MPAAYNLPRLVLLLRCPEYSWGVEVIPQMDEYYSVIQFLPEPLRTELKAMPPERAARVQEIRASLLTQVNLSIFSIAP